MSDHETGSESSVLLRVAGVGVLLLIAGVAGLVVGQWSAPEYVPAAPEAHEPGQLPTGAKQTPSEELQPLEEVPLFFFTGQPKQENLTLVGEEVAMAAKAGVHRYVLPVPLPWESGEEASASLEPVRHALEHDPTARFLLQVDCNPSAAWLDQRPDERVGADYASTSSQDWLNVTCLGLASLLKSLDDSGLGERVQGFILCGLEEGQWIHPAGFDTSVPALLGFRRWLTTVYMDDAALQQAWSSPESTLAEAAIPEPPGEPTNGEAFLPLPDMQAVADFRTYLSTATADAIAALASHMRGACPREVLLLAPYGFSLELPRSGAGHYALGNLLESDLDGFVCPISALSGGLGKSGGPVAPVHSAQYHGKQWYLMDNTETGLGRQPLTGLVGRLRGFPVEDVYNVQRRNFALAAIHGLGLIWADSLGEGLLHDPEQWDLFAGMQQLLASLYAAQPVPEPPFGAVPATPSPRESVLPLRAPGFEPTLTVVVDEQSPAYGWNGEALDQALLTQGRDAALRAGAAVHFVLLQDVLDDLAPPAKAYLFLNAFKLTNDQREALHVRLAREEACAIWLYAPGFLGSESGAAAVGVTVQMKVRAFQDESVETGSEYGFDGHWVRHFGRLGEQRKLSPLFFIDDPEVDVLAHYRDSGRGSVAMRFLPAGWSTVFVAEPAISAELLREILRLVEVQIPFRAVPEPLYDAVYTGRGLLAVHAREAGDRAVDLGAPYDVQDVFTPSLGWPQKESFLLPLKKGETRLLQLKTP